MTAKPLLQTRTREELPRLGQTGAMRFQSWLFFALIVPVVIAAAGVSEAAPVRKIVPKGAVSFTSKAQRFSVWMPYSIVGGERVFSMAEGGTFSLFYFKSNNEPFLYAIIVTSPSKVSQLKPEKILDALQNRSLNSTTKLQKREQIQLDKFIGRDLKFSSMGGKAAIRTRIYLTPKRSYQILTSNRKAAIQKQSAQINRVFDSFRILPQ